MELLTSLRRGERQSEQELLSLDFARSPSASASPSIAISEYTSPENQGYQDVQAATIMASVQEPQTPGSRLRRFYIRTSISIVFPLFMTSYFVFIWTHFMAWEPSHELYTGHRGGSWVFYAWFVLTTLALNIGKYISAGTEAGLLMDKRWAPNNAAGIMHHGEHSWAGLSGWLYLAKVFVARLRAQRTPFLPSRAWITLCFINAMLLVGTPLSGLAIEPTRGYTRSNGHPTVVGRNYSNFNLDRDGTFIKAQDQWQIAEQPRLPRLGIIYTSPNMSRCPAHLKFTPNSLPVDDGTETIFLAPQADAPIYGSTWGLALRYDCQISTADSDFVLLAQRPNGTSAASVSPLNENCSTSISIGFTSFASNFKMLFMVARDGMTNQDGYLSGYQGLEAEQAIEIQLWQYLNTSTETDDISADKYNTSIDHQILGTKVPAYLPVYQGSEFENFSLPADSVGVGVRCTSSSAVGTAEIDDRTASFNNFQPGDTEKKNESWADHLSLGAAGVFFERLWDGPEGRSNLNGLAWNFFTSAGFPVPRKSLPYHDIGTSYFQAEHLKTSMLRMHASYAMQLMYDNTNAPWTGEGGVLETVGHTVIRQTFVPPAAVVTLLGIWTTLSVGFAVFYGFRRRWAETLDAHCMFLFGADHADVLKDNSGIVRTVRDEQLDGTLVDMPGMVGDSEKGKSPGHITLVRNEKGNEASTSRQYY